MKTIKHIITTVMLIALVAFVTACSKVSSETFAKVENGMTEDQVKSLIGSPSELNSGGVGPLSTATYKYTSGGQEYTVSFMNGKVVMKEQHSAK